MNLNAIIAFTFLGISIFSVQLSAQNEFYDAEDLKTYLNGNKFSSGASKIFLSYFPIDTSLDTDDKKISALNELIKLNPFYQNYTISKGNVQGDFKFDIKKILSNIGNLDVTTIADGFAKFIVERTKKELQAAFFDRFIEEMNKKEYKDVHKLFPATFNLVQQLPSEIYNYDTYLQSFRDAFGKDMESILPHLEDVIKNGQYEAFFDKHLELKSICLTALYYGKGLQRGTHIGKLIADYNPNNLDYNWSTPNANMIKTNAIFFIQEVSKSFQTGTQAKEYWVPADSIMMLLNDDVTFNIYLGLLYQRVKDLKICNTDNKTYGTVMASMVQNVDQLKSLIENISDQINNVQIQVKNFQEKAKKDRTLDDYIAYFNSATRIIESFKENEFVNNLSSNLDSTSKTDLDLYWHKYSEMIDATNAVLSIYSSIKEKNYSITISNVRKLYQMRFEPAEAKDTINKTKVEEVIKFLVDKGLFIASVAQAKTSEEVYEAINMIAMPSGSSRVKRLSNFNIAVNAYCGLFAGNEIIKGFEPNRPFTRFNTFGITAPIGFTMSKGKRYLPWPISELCWFNKSKAGWSTSWFISLVDLGALTAFRFSNDSIDQVPTIQLKDTFSPGIFWSLGLPKSPISINFGVQLGPNLRKVHELSNDYSNNTYFRYSVSVCVDLPVLNLYTKGR